MSEYLMQLALKVEISGEDTTRWDITDIATVLKSSLLKLHQEENNDYNEVMNIQILHVIDYLLQFNPTICTEKVTSYFHKNGTRHWFYIGSVTEQGKTQKYEAASFLSQMIDPSGILPLSHVITVQEGEIKVIGHAKFSSLKNTTHKIKKMTMPSEMKNMMKQSMVEMFSMPIKKKPVAIAALKTVEKKIGKKKVYSVKKSGVASFLKYIAPGASTLLFDEAGPSSPLSIESNEDIEEAKENRTTYTNEGDKDPRY